MIAVEIPPLIPTLARAEATDILFRRLVHATDRTLRGLARQVAGGEISLDQWQHEMLTTLAKAHAQAGFHGRQRAGDLAAFDVDDTRFGALVAQEELLFVQAFRDDLMGDRYRAEGGALDERRVADRAALYASRLHGTANEALVLVADEAEWTWTLGKQDNCEDCLELAANSPYRGGPPPVLPRSGKTACLTQCGCVCVSSSGLRTFAP